MAGVFGGADVPRTQRASPRPCECTLLELQESAWRRGRYQSGFGTASESSVSPSIHARHVSAALSLQVNKTDANDAHGIAQVVRSGWYRAVSVKSLQSCRIRSLLTARTELVSIRT